MMKMPVCSQLVAQVDISSVNGGLLGAFLFMGSQRFQYSEESKVCVPHYSSSKRRMHQQRQVVQRALRCNSGRHQKHRQQQQYLRALLQTVSEEKAERLLYILLCSLGRHRKHRRQVLRASHCSSSTRQRHQQRQPDLRASKQNKKQISSLQGCRITCAYRLVAQVCIRSINDGGCALFME
jgi:hypothetical protein